MSLFNCKRPTWSLEDSLQSIRARFDDTCKALCDTLKTDVLDTQTLWGRTIRGEIERIHRQYALRMDELTLEVRGLPKEVTEGVAESYEALALKLVSDGTSTIINHLIEVESYRHEWEHALD